MLRLFFAIDTTNGLAEQAQIAMQAKLFTGGVVPGLNSARSVRGIFPRVNPCGCASFRKSGEKLFRACKNIFTRELKKDAASASLSCHLKYPATIPGFLLQRAP
jgi:hypothetical protein